MLKMVTLLSTGRDSGPLQDHLLAKPDQNLQCECWHDLGCAITFKRIENDISTIYIVRDIASGPLQDHLLSQPDRKLKIGLRHATAFQNTFKMRYQPSLYVQWLPQGLVYKFVFLKKNEEKRS